MKHSLLLVLLLALGVGAAYADPREGRLGIGGEFGLWKQIGGEWNYGNVDQLGNLKVRYGLTAPWTLELGLKYGWMRPGVATRGASAGLTFESGSGLYTRIWQPNLTGTYRFIDRGIWQPWMSVGIGVTRWDVRDLRGVENVGLWPDGRGLRVYDTDGERRDGHGLNVTASLGLGIEIWADQRWSFDVGLRYNYLVNQRTDMVGFSAFWGTDHVDAGKAIIEGLVGVSYWFGRPTGPPEPVLPLRPDQDYPPLPDPEPQPDPEREPVVERSPFEEARVLKDVVFAVGSSDLTPSSLASLDKIADELLAWPEVIVEIASYTDNTGSADLNRRLSQARAESVRDYLIRRGVPSFRITARGHGEDNPIADNATPEGRAANRRIVVVPMR